MPIINTVITGGGQGGGDKVTALVGSNASGIDVGDKVILNYPAANETGYCSEYRFQNQTRDSGQWTIFFGAYMMYVDTSGHPVFFKHDTVNDKLVFVKALGVTLPTIGTVESSGSGATRITYNETTKRFAVCKNGTLTIYQAEISDTDANISTIYSATTIAGNGGIAQDTDTFWYMTTSGNFDSIVVKDFTYSNGTFIEGSAYTHTNTCPAFSGGTCTYVAFSPNLEKFTVSNGINGSGKTFYIAGVTVDKQTKQVTYGASVSSFDLNNYAPLNSVVSLNNNGNGVVTQIYSGNLRQASFNVASDASISDVIVGTSTDYTSGIGSSGSIPYSYYGFGIVHQTGDWVTGPIFALNITPSGFSKIDITAALPGTSGAACPSNMIAALSSTGIFMWPYTVNGSGSSISFNNILTRWNNGAPTRGDTYIEPASNIGLPLYFDGDYLYATGGVYATDGQGGLTRLGNSGLQSSSSLIYNPPTFLSDGTVVFGNTTSGSGTLNLAYLNVGTVSGSIGDNRYYLTDARLDSSKTGFAVVGKYYSTAALSIVHLTNGAQDAYSGSTYRVGFLDAQGNAYIGNYNTSAGNFYTIQSCTYSGSSITTTDLFTSTTLYTLIGTLNTSDTNKICAADRIDNYQFWYRAGDRIYGFAKFDLTNSSIDILTTPLAIQQVSGTVYAAWWDLDNKLFIRTSTGLFAFAYTNHDISTMQLIKKFEWSTDYSGPATCSNDLKSYAVGNDTYVRVVRETVMPVYEFSANVYNGQNFAGTSLTGFVNEAITTDPWGQSIVEVNTVKDPADTWTNVGLKWGFDVSTTSANVSVGRGYYNSGSAEVIIPATVTKTIAQIGTNQTLGYKNDIYVYRDTSDVCSDLMCKTGTTPVGSFKASTALTTPVYLSPDKTVIAGTNADSGFAVSYEAEHATQPNYTVVGSPTIDSNYVASGFSSSNYILSDYSLDISQDFEVGCKCKINSSNNNYTPVFGAPDGVFIFLGKDNNNNPHFNLLNSGGSWGSGPRLSSFTMSVGGTYYLKGIKSGNTLTVYASTDGETWESASSTFTVGTRTGPFRIGCETGNNNAFPGSIYLADTYIKVNGSTALKLVTPATDGDLTVGAGYSYIDETDAPYYLDSDLTRSASQMVVHSEDFVEQSTEVQNFEVVGNVTIENKVASGFSSSNYLTTSMPSASSTLFLKIKAGASTSSRRCICDGSIPIYQEGTSLVIANSYAGQWQTISSVVVGTIYWLKVVLNNSYLTIFISTDGEAYSQVYNRSWGGSQTTIGYLGYYPDRNPFDGEIHLDNCYSCDSNDVIIWSAYESETVKQGTLFLTQPTAGTTSSVVSANATPTATYVGSVVDPIDMGKTVTMDTTLTKILSVEDE